ncbi:uncharacterized protein BX664DRAFT_380153 [Halteromyces radiatus]|uniref:uncharacterized protein n=1 Tax=Halteromyces radiatus TaxID=101107 RepID=UPI002220BC88|nr:uncharacterized protein BX664DRAFT_380153 [Halteromyces radiatus]KAI8084860.1 hypothetical protein BX664DRAFT_380153 [Halteromyces radiatus]
MTTHRVFSSKFLARLKKPLKESDVKATFVYNENKQKGFWRPAQVSRRVQNDLRKACLQQNIDPLTLGLPASTPAKPLRYKPNKLEKHERMRAERQETIRKNLEKMPQTIQAWKEDKMKELAKQKTSMPF